jgi:hypothetical protein
MANGINFHTWRFDGSQWHKVPAPSQQTSSVWCASAQDCLAASSSGLLGYDGTKWQIIASFELPGFGFFDAVDCASLFCVATTPIDASIGTHV